MNKPLGFYFEHFNYVYCVKRSMSSAHDVCFSAVLKLIENRLNKPGFGNLLGHWCSFCGIIWWRRTWRNYPYQKQTLDIVGLHVCVTRIVIRYNLFTTKMCLCRYLDCDKIYPLQIIPIKTYKFDFWCFSFSCEFCWVCFCCRNRTYFAWL